jgi:hypothetical protein
VLFLAEKHAPDALAVSTGRKVERLVSSGRGAHEGAEQADAGCGTPARLVHFCVAADAGTERSASASGAIDVSAWHDRVVTGRWGASDHPPADASDGDLRYVEPLCSTLDVVWLSVRSLAPACPVLLWQRENDFQ